MLEYIVSLKTVAWFDLLGQKRLNLWHSSDRIWAVPISTPPSLSLGGGVGAIISLRLRLDMIYILLRI